MKAKILTSIPGSKSAKHLALNKKLNGGWVVPHPFVHSGYGSGCYFKDIDGNTFLDFASQIASNPLGYNHPDIKKVIKRYTNSAPLKYAGQDFLVKEHNDLLEELLSITPQGFNAGFLINSGAEAVENAIKICMRKQKKAKYCISFKNAFHGRTLGALSLTNTAKKQQKENFFAIPTQRLPYSEEAGDVLRNMLKTISPEEIACIIMEPIQGEGGYNIPSEKMVKDIRTITKEHNIPLISDEVQAGMGRTGEWWGIQNFSVKPDVIAAAKALQVGATMANKAMFPTEPGSISSTWGGGHLIDLAVGAETIRSIKKQKLLSKVKKQGKDLLKRLHELSESFPVVLRPRGMGLMTAFDLPSNKLRNDVIIEAVKRGLVILGCGMQGIRLIPPYIVTQKEMNEAIEILQSSIKTCVPSTFQHRGPICDFMDCGETRT